MGNQMFQYAIARAISLRAGCDFAMDTVNGLGDQFGNVTVRKYALNCFNVHENVASVEQLEKLGIKSRSKAFKFIALVFLKIFGNWNRFRILEKSFSFDEKIIDLKGDYYLEGFWQSEKYFIDFAEAIRQDFKLKSELSVDELEIAKEIKSSNSVSLHIRRGDYVANAAANKFHGICSLNYYQDAVEYFGEKVSNPIFYIFSDDIDWVKENLKINFPMKFVSDGVLKDYEELTLMSFCKHGIIANSSFSWWGAWLNANEQKIVIAPKHWFADEKIDTSDVVPEAWVRL
jgi:hypothetical protein